MPNVVTTQSIAYGEYGAAIQPVSPTHPLPVASTGAGGEPALTVGDLRSGTSTFASVASGITSVTLLAANPNRNGAVIVNTDANILYVDTSGGTASASRYSHALATGGTLEVPARYTGIITGVWAVDGTGAALVTEYSS